MPETSDNWFEQEQLHFAAGDGDLETVKRLLQQGADLNAFDDLGWTPLIHAAKRGHVDVVRCLLAAGAQVDARDEARAGNTALAEVAAECSLEMAKALVEAGADPRIPGWAQLTALDRAKKRQRGDGPKVYELLSTIARKLG
ncbi:MAG TPA: ankyrin repeat domain-containing protein [Stellaceae bacterium]|nr:ankyrin repeat domain-containing protein [Stellaceae bacterium]